MATFVRLLISLSLPTWYCLQLYRVVLREGMGWTSHRRVGSPFHLTSSGRTPRDDTHNTKTETVATEVAGKVAAARRTADNRIDVPRTTA